MKARSPARVMLDEFRTQPPDEALERRLLGYLFLPCHGDPMPGKGNTDWKAGNPCNTCITRRFIECNPSGRERNEIILIPIERKTLTGLQGFGENLLGDRFKGRGAGG